MMIFAHITEFARDTARMQNGKIPTKKEEEAVLREMCGNIMTHIEEILTDEKGEFPTAVDKVDAIAYIFEKYTQQRGRSYPASYELTENPFGIL